MTEILKFGHYEVKSELGRGGMGVVYRAVETSLNREVAIKALSPALANDPIVVERFLREAKSAAAINHPNVIPVYFAGQEGTMPYFAMELVEGQPLSELIRATEPFSARQAANIILQSARGLKAAHEKGLIHRDIKPANLMVTEDGTVKIADFGIASRDSVDKRLTNTGEFLGTPGYLSPEVCKAEDVDQRSDIFSLGIVYFELLTGKIPFTDQSPLGMMLEVVEAKIPDVRLLNPSLDEDTRQILYRMLAKEPADRYQSCDELISHLEDGFSRDAFSINAPAELEQAAATTANKVIGDSAPITVPYHSSDVFARKEEPATLPATLPGANKSKGVPAWAIILGLVLSLGAGGAVLWSNMGSGAGGDGLQGKLQKMLLAVTDDSIEALPEAELEPESAAQMVDDDSNEGQDSGKAPAVEKTMIRGGEEQVSLVDGPRDSLRIEEATGVEPSPAAQAGMKLAVSPANGERMSGEVMAAIDSPGREDTVGNAKNVINDGGISQKVAVGVSEIQKGDQIVAGGTHPGQYEEPRRLKAKQQIARVDPAVASLSRLKKGKGRILALASGDPALNSIMQQMLNASLSNTDMESVEIDFVSGIPAPEGRVGLALAQLSPQLLSQNIDVLLLLRLQYTGDEILTYYGESSRLLNVSVTADVYSLGDRKRLGHPWQSRLAYTELNREIKMAELLADLEDEVYPAIFRVMQAE